MPLAPMRPFRDPCVSPALLEAWEYGFVSSRWYLAVSLAWTVLT